MFGRKKRVVDDERTMMIGLNSGSGANEGLTLGDVRDFVYRSMTLGVPLQSPVSVTPTRKTKKVHGISVATADIPKPPDPSMLWPPTPAHGLPLHTLQTANGTTAVPQQNFHDGGTAEQQVQYSD